MSALETWLWIVLVMAAVIAVHPAIDIIADAKWKLDNRIVWAQSQKSSVWRPMHMIFRQCTKGVQVNPAYANELRAVKMKEWAKVYRGEASVIEAAKNVIRWSEGRK